jgi:hypothetical protein
MDPFSREDNQAKGPQSGEDFPRLFQQPHQEFFFVDQPSKVEAGIDKTTSSISKALKLVLFCCAFIGLAALVYPYARLLWEFTNWAYRQAGMIFP